MVRGAVIGCGRMGTQVRRPGVFPAGWLPMSHAEALEAAGIELVALCDVDAGRLEIAGRTHFVSGLYRDYREMLEAVRPDVVTIATRTPQKAEIVRACRNVPHVYVEKPLANSLKDAREMLTRPLGYGVNRRYHAAYRRARDIMQSGVIGILREAVFEFGRSPLMWCHPHTVDLAAMFFGPDVIDIEARLTGEGDPLVDFARFTFPTGSAVITQGNGCTMRLHGTEGTLTVHADGSFLELASGRDYHLDQRFIHPQPQEGATVTALRELVNGEHMPQDHILAGMRMLVGCVWSHMQGRRVRADEVPDDIVVTGLGPHGYA
jgi:scyllo-inositol 2-dehydrogenase (NAD+)